MSPGETFDGQHHLTKHVLFRYVKIHRTMIMNKIKVKGMIYLSPSFSPNLDLVSARLFLLLLLSSAVSAEKKELIKHGYTAVGILEEWNTTLALYDTALDMPGMDWKTWYAKDGKQNVNVMYEELKARTLEKAWTDPELKKYLQLDLLLYEHAVDVFNEQARSHGVLR